MVAYMVAYVNMGMSKAKLGSSLPSNVAVGADWGGPEAISHELTEIQLQLSNLTNPTDPQEVNIEGFSVFIGGNYSTAADHFSDFMVPNT